MWAHLVSSSWPIQCTKYNINYLHVCRILVLNQSTNFCMRNILVWVNWTLTHRHIWFSIRRNLLVKIYTFIVLYGQRKYSFPPSETKVSQIASACFHINSRLFGMSVPILDIILSDAFDWNEYNGSGSLFFCIIKMTYLIHEIYSLLCLMDRESINSESEMQKSAEKMHSIKYMLYNIETHKKVIIHL